MKQGLNIQNSLVPGPVHYSNNLKGTFSIYSLVFLPVFFLLLIKGYKNEPQHSSPKKDMAGSVPSQGNKIRWISYKGSFKAIDEMSQAGTYADPMHKDHLLGTGEATGMRRTSVDAYIEGDISMGITAKVTTMATFTTANGDKIFEKAYGYVQVKKYTRVLIYLL